METELKGKGALVSGASRGIGKGIALALAREGCSLAICAREQGPLEEAASELAEAGAPQVFARTLDVTDREAAEPFVAAAVEELGRLDVLVNNVGGNRRKSFEETTDEDWDDLLELNLLSALRLSRLAIPEMRKAGGGAITFISSIFGREAGGAGLSLYNVTKTAMISAAKIMAMELASEGIRVNSVAPGSIRFPGGSWDRRVKEDPEGMAEFISANLPLGRFGTVEEVANLVVFLSSPQAGLITGACIPADGSQGRSLI